MHHLAHLCGWRKAARRQFARWSEFFFLFLVCCCCCWCCCCCCVCSCCCCCYCRQYLVVGVGVWIGVSVCLYLRHPKSKQCQGARLLAGEFDCCGCLMCKKIRPSTGFYRALLIPPNLILNSLFGVNMSANKHYLTPTYYNFTK